MTEKKRKGRPSKKSQAELQINEVESENIKEDSVELIDTIQEMIDVVKAVSENVEQEEDVQDNVEDDSVELIDTIHEMIDTAKAVQEKVKEPKKKADPFDIIKWRRLGRR